MKGPSHLRVLEAFLPLSAVILAMLTGLSSCGDAPSNRKTVKVAPTGAGQVQSENSKAADENSDTTDSGAGNYGRIEDAIKSGSQTAEPVSSSESLEGNNADDGTEKTNTAPTVGVEDGALRPIATEDKPATTQPGGQSDIGDVAAGSLNLASKFASGFPSGLQSICESGAGTRPALPSGATPVVGTDQGDILTGDDNANFLSGGLGNDQISGLGGNDILHGNQGADLIGAGPGNDLIFSGEGDDQSRGGDGDDGIIGGTGNDSLMGDLGNDQLFGDEGDDKVDGGPGNDRIDGGIGSDELQGGEGSDFVGGNDDNDTVRGGAGNDCVNGGNGNDLVVGGGGSDVLRGGPGSDVLHPLNETITGECTEASFAGCSQDWLFGDPTDGTGGGDDTFVIGDSAGLVVIMPDAFGSNVVDCKMTTKPSRQREGDDLFLLSGTTLVKVVSFFKSGETKMTFTQGCL